MKSAKSVNITSIQREVNLRSNHAIVTEKLYTISIFLNKRQRISRSSWNRTKTKRDPLDWTNVGFTEKLRTDIFNFDFVFHEEIPKHFATIT